MAITLGYGYVLEAIREFDRSVALGVVLVAVTGGWFILSAFLVLVDTVTTWRATAWLSVATLAFWAATHLLPGITDPEEIEELTEPLPLLTVALTAVLLLVAARVARAPLGAGTVGREARGAVLAGVLSLAVGVALLVVAAVLTAAADPQEPADASSGTRDTRAA